jgi:hypothetical protein
MRKAYILAHSRTLGTREEIKACLNAIPEILTWRTDMLHSFFLISEADAKTLAARIRECRGHQGRFMVTEVEKGRASGWLTKDSWYLLNHKTKRPKDD